VDCLKRCLCHSPVVESCKSSPNTTRCVQCRGWFSLSVSSAAELEALRLEMRLDHDSREPSEHGGGLDAIG
jgi:hypothetical protein